MAKAKTTKQPTILILRGDDIGWWNISYNSLGQMGYRAPNIDRIANEGVAFTDYYGQQSCTAGRAAFITGVQALLEPRVAAAEVIDPDRRIDQHRLTSPSRPAPRDPLHSPFSPSEARQAPCALPRHQGLEPGVKNGCLLPDATQPLSLQEQGVIDVEGGSHMHEYPHAMQTRQATCRVVRLPNPTMANATPGL